MSLQASLPGADTCPLEYAWFNSAAHGTLTGGGSQPDSFTSTNPVATYEAAEGSPGSDAVDVRFTAMPPDGGSPVTVGRACADVDVGERPMQAGVLHVVFDGSGTWQYNTIPGSGCHGSGSVDMTWHAVFDVPLVDLPFAFNRTLFGAGWARGPSPGTTVTGTSTYDDGVRSCAGPIEFHPRFPGMDPVDDAPSPHVAIVHPERFDGENVLLGFSTFGGVDYYTCNRGVLLADTEPNTHQPPPGYPAYGGFISWTEPVPISLSEWAGQPPHSRVIPVNGNATGSTRCTNATAQWQGTITLSTSP